MAKPLVALVIAAVLVSTSAVAEENKAAAKSGKAAAKPVAESSAASSSQLISQAQYWEAKGRYDLARESWLKLLRISPDNPEALSGLANAEAKSGRAAAAQVYLDRLREAHPNYTGLRGIEDSIRAGAFDQTRLEEPRALTRAGDYEAAAKKFREVYANQIPGGRLGLEYYQTLAGTKGGWDDARRGIEGLIRANPDDAIYKLALAQHLTYREETRRQGIADLSELAGNAVISLQTKQAWRQALIWLGAKKGADERYYRTYLAKYGDDAQISQKLAALERAGSGGVVVTDTQGQLQTFGGASRSTTRASSASIQPEVDLGPTPDQIRGRQVKEAFDALNSSELEIASSKFEQLVAQYPNDADSLGGLGIVRLRQSNYRESRLLLQSASQAAPKSAGRWKDALAAARFWEQVRQGDAAREAGNPTEAERYYRAALASDPALAKKEVSVRSTLADVLAESSDLPAAERLYREILAEKPDFTAAINGLMGIMTRSNRLAEAIAMAEKLPADARAQLGNIGVLKGQYLRDQAQLATENKDDVRAEALLKEALLLDPESPWTRLDLARIYQRNHRVREANTLIDGLLTSGKQMADAMYIKALLLAEQQDWYNGLTLLEQVSPNNRTPEMTRLQKRLWVRYQTQRAGVMARYGRQPEAVQVLTEVELQNQNSTAELLGALAQAWADVGEEGRSLMYMRQALSRSDANDKGMRLQYASLLFKLRQDAEFEVVMEDLLRFKGWTEQQSLDLANMRIAYRLRQADLVREEGDLARAYEYIEPLLRVNANDPRLLMALARLYNDAKEFDRTLQLYRRALQIDANNLDAYKGAIGAALAMNQPEQAEELLDKAFALDPDNARLYALAGRAAKARGEEGRALELFQQALRLDQAKGGESEFGGDTRYSPKLYLLKPGDRSYAPISQQPFLGSLDPDSRKFHPPIAARVAQAAVNHGPDTKPGLRVSMPAHQQLLKRFWLKVKNGRHVQKGRLIRVSTPARDAVAPSEATVDYSRQETMPRSSQGTWVQSGSNRYSYTIENQVPAAVSTVPYGGNSVTLAPRQVQAAPPVQIPARPQAPLTSNPRDYAQVFPRDYGGRLNNTLSQPPRRESLRDEVLRDIDSLQKRPASYGDSRGAGTIAPVQQPPPVLNSIQAANPWQTVQQPIEPYAVIPQPVYAAPAEAPVYVPSAPVVVSNPAPIYAPVETYSMPPRMDIGAPVEAYERQGLQVLGDRSYPASAPVPVPVYPSAGMTPVMGRTTYGSVAPPPQPAPVTRQPMQLRQDPLLGTPDFVLERRRPRFEQPNEVLREIAGLQSKRSSWGGIGFMVRNRDGLPGLDRLTDIEIPVEFSFAGAQAGRIKLRATPVSLDTGGVSGKQLPLFGALALVNNPNLAFQQSASGVALGVAYELAEFRADVGSTPLGFPVESVVGGINWRPKFDDTVIQLDLSRRSVTDSKLSYAGARDPATGIIWGGVTKTGGRLDVAQDMGGSGVYGNAAYYFLDGTHVVQNSNIELGVGAYMRGIERKDMRVTYGLNVTSFFYEKNIRRFTLGHGGYFSPQSYLAISVPVEWEGGRDRFSYRLNGSIGLQSFREDGAALFPFDSGLQTALEEFAALNVADDIPTGYGSKSSTGLGYTLAGNFEYLVTPQVIAGARLSLDNARDYREAYALGYMRYMFAPQTRVNIPPAPLYPYFNFGDPRL